MKSVFRSAAVQLSRALPLRGLAGLAHAPLVVYYHLVGDRSIPHIRHLYDFKAAEAFERDLDYLLKIYRPLDLDDLLQALSGSIIPRSLFVTFDDGLRQAAEIAAPILKRKGIPAAFFLSSAFLDNRELFYRFKASLLIDRLISKGPSVDRRKAESLLREAGVSGESLRSSLLRVTYRQRAVLDAIASAWEVSFEEFLAREAPYMTSNQVRLLVQQGFYVGGHGIDHPKFDELSLEEQLHQTLGCLDRLAEEFSLQRRIFSFPFTAGGLSDAYFSAVLAKDVIEAFFGTGGFGVDIQKRLFDRVSFDDMTRPGLKRKYLEYLRQGSKAP